MTTIIIPTRHRPDMLLECLVSLMAARKVPEIVIVVVDDDPKTALLASSFPWANFIVNTENLGFWQSINRAFKIARLSEDELFCYFGQDVTFDKYWLVQAEYYFPRRFRDGLGLATFKDDIHDGGNASHGISTRAWLRIIYGEPFFPREYFHYFCDSEFTVRSRDLGRFGYCKGSYVPHHHEPIEVAKHKPDDKAIQDRRHLEWVNGDKNEAKKRLKVA